MPPPSEAFPVSSLPDHIHSKSINFKEKSRKLPSSFSLNDDCELLKIVQYTCTNDFAIIEHEKSESGEKFKPKCYPFTRLFRKCKEGGIGGEGRVFHVETTAWEGEFRYDGKKEEAGMGKENGDAFAKYGSYFWKNE